MVSEWGPWSPCPVECDSSAYTERKRVVLRQPSNGGVWCPEKMAEKKRCTCRQGWTSTTCSSMGWDVTFSLLESHIISGREVLFWTPQILYFWTLVSTTCMYLLVLKRLTVNIKSIVVTYFQMTRRGRMTRKWVCMIGECERPAMCL